MLVEIVNAAWDTTSIFWGVIDLWEFLLLAISIFVLFASVFSILFILRGWILLILSWWKDEKIKPAINTIRYAFIWLVVTIATIFLFPVFGRLLWLDVKKYAEPKAIFAKIEEIWWKFFWKSSTSTSWDQIDNISEDDFVNSL